MSLDVLIGAGMLAVATAVFVYYTTWVLIVPFVEEPHFIYSLFPPREWAIRIPVILILLGVLVIGSFVGSVLVASAKKEKLKQQSKKKA